MKRIAKSVIGLCLVCLLLTLLAEVTLQYGNTDESSSVVKTQKRKNASSDTGDRLAATSSEPREILDKNGQKSDSLSGREKLEFGGTVRAEHIDDDSDGPQDIVKNELHPHRAVSSANVENAVLGETTVTAAAAAEEEDNDVTNSTIRYDFPRGAEIIKEVRSCITCHRVVTTQNAGFYRRRSTKVNAFPYRAVFQPTELCQQDTFLLILVQSHPIHIHRRRAIRQTWGSAVRTGNWPRDSGSCKRIRLAFVLGQHPESDAAIQVEQSEKGDIVQGNFVDSYRNLTLKTLLCLKVTSQLCPQAKYLLKADDDMFVNLPYMLDRLRQNRLERAAWGAVLTHARARRSGKWKLTYSEFPFDILPPYACGSAYILTTDILKMLLEASEYVPFIHLEDVYVTGIVGRIVGLKLVDGNLRRRGPTHKLFAYSVHTAKPPTLCDILRRRILTGTEMTPNKQTIIWNELNSQVTCGTGNRL